MFAFDAAEATRAFLAKRQSMRAVAKEAGVNGTTLQKAILGQPLMSEPAAKISVALGVEPKWVDAQKKKRREEGLNVHRDT